jgi:hypothetical protein
VLKTYLRLFFLVMAGVARQKLRPSWRTQKDYLARARGGTVIRALKRIFGSVRYSGFGARAQFAGSSLPHLPAITATR